MGVNWLYWPAKRCRKTGSVSISGKIPCDNAAGAPGCAALGIGRFTITRITENKNCSSPFRQSGTVQGVGGPAEIVVLGDVVYLRWEAEGRVQEDSLLLSKEGQRLEGTFVNNAGGWGAITGKRTAACAKR